MGIFSGIFSKNNKKKVELSKESDVYFKAAEAYFKKRDYFNSKKFFEKALEINPQHQNAQRNLEVVNNKIKIISSNREKDKIHSKDKDFDNNNSNINLQTSQKTSKLKESKSSIIVDESISNGQDRLDAKYYYNYFNLDKSFSNEEIKDSLSKEFRSWRTKINSPDPKKKYEAEEMLNKIAKARKLLLN